jgi:DNA-binding response OmpR family regulator
VSGQLLVVDDDRFLLENVARLLRTQGYAVDTAASGEEAIRALGTRVPDLVILDISLPDFDGITLCRRLRSTHRFPIIMLTARTDAMDKVIGLEVGADDYLTKPFEPSELIARVRAHLRRVGEYATAAPAAASRTVIGGLVIDHDARDAFVDGQAAHLTKREFELLTHLATNVGRVVTRDSLFEHNWGFDIEFSSNSLDVHIYRLRKKIEPDLEHPRYIHTLRGYGYKLEAV